MHCCVASADRVICCIKLNKWCVTKLPQTEVQEACSFFSPGHPNRLIWSCLLVPSSTNSIIWLQNCFNSLHKNFFRVLPPSPFGTLWVSRNLERTTCHVIKVSTFVSLSKTDHSGLTCRDTGCRVIQGWLLGVFAEAVIYIHTHVSTAFTWRDMLTGADS